MLNVHILDYKNTQVSLLHLRLKDGYSSINTEEEEEKLELPFDESQFSQNILLFLDAYSTSQIDNMTIALNALHDIICTYYKSIPELFGIIYQHNNLIEAIQDFLTCNFPLKIVFIAAKFTYLFTFADLEIIQKYFSSYFVTQLNTMIKKPANFISEENLLSLDKNTRKMIKLNIRLLLENCIYNLLIRRIIPYDEFVLDVLEFLNDWFIDHRYDICLQTSLFIAHALFFYYYDEIHESELARDIISRFIYFSYTDNCCEEIPLKGLNDIFQKHDTVICLVSEQTVFDILNKYFIKCNELNYREYCRFISIIGCCNIDQLQNIVLQNFPSQLILQFSYSQEENNRIEFINMILKLASNESNIKNDYLNLFLNNGFFLRLLEIGREDTFNIRKFAMEALIFHIELYNSIVLDNLIEIGLLIDLSEFISNIRSECNTSLFNKALDIMLIHVEQKDIETIRIIFNQLSNTGIFDEYQSLLNDDESLDEYEIRIIQHGVYLQEKCQLEFQ